MVLAILGSLFGIAVVGYLGLKILAPWVFLDISYIKTAKTANDKWEAQKKQGKLIIDVFEDTVQKFAKKSMLIFGQFEYTFEQIDRKANQVARTALDLGLKSGDVVAMLQYNEPAFVWNYLGFQKVGVQIAFINTNLRSISLLHSIKASQPKLLLLGQGKELQDAVLDIRQELTEMDIYSQDSDTNIGMSTLFKSFNRAMQTSSQDPIEKSHRAGIEYSTPYVYIYTSGTTGLPKPAIISQVKASRAAYVMTLIGNGNDLLYETLPLYHSAGSMLGIGFSMATGATVVLRSKFSAGHFWEDCRKHKVTVIHYVGELCRYLVATEKSPDDSNHQVRCAFGNGLRKDVWKEFQSRFNVPQIAEFYAATEMPVGFINLTNKFGSVGRSSPLLRKVLPCTFVKFDHQTQEPKRNSQGRCIACKSEEIGLLIIALTKEFTFEGYKGCKEENEKKILHHVFKEGDRWINSGDLMYVDKDYDIYFNDRVGDTFRWKGENVSTTEVANVISSLDFVHDTTVYGVKVPGCEGRAGMAALTLNKVNWGTLTSEQLDNILTKCNDLLPSYARPRFIRVLLEMELTGTFKQKKAKLLEEGFNINKMESVVYFMDQKTSGYSPVDKTSYYKILDGDIKL